MRIAVIGTGIAGNAAAWTLSKRYTITVYDRELRPGGHSHTVTVDYDGAPLAVDIGLIVYNELNYPDLTALRNTFGDIHAYVLPVQPGEISDAGIRQQQDKLFHVSPFIEMAMRYHFRILPPGVRIKLRVLETDRGGPLLAATFNGRRRSLNTPALLWSFCSLPLVTLKILAAIHWEALRLWLKGARLVPRPIAAPANASFDTTLATGERKDYTDPRKSALVR
jgi:phytoene dehydrogenase-like protein